MADQPPCLAEELVTGLIIQLLRNGTLSAEDVTAAAAGLSEDARHVAHSLIVEAEAPSVAEWQAGQRRARIHIVKDQ